jgi:2-phosphosulfolactate phosphatase
MLSHIIFGQTILVDCSFILKGCSMFFTQEEFDIRCEWGYSGVTQLAPYSDVMVIVDVLSFSTCVDIAVSKGAIVYPYQWKDERAVGYARSHDAILASFHRKFDAGYSLSPTSLLTIPKGVRLVLPSPNGSTLSLSTANVPTFAGCLRNAQAIANTAQRVGQRVTIIPAGERWVDGTLRPSLEDWIGAGAIIHHLSGTRSPEAQIAEGAFLQACSQLEAILQQCSSGKELLEQGFGNDVALAAMLNTSNTAPILVDKAYRNFV